MSDAQAPRIEVVAGAPTAEEVAAIAAVVLAAGTAGAPAPAPRRSGWMTAARLEGMGGAPAASARDPRLHAR